MIYNDISLFEKAVIRNALYSDLTMHRCVPSIILYSTIVELHRHKVRCKCSHCSSKTTEIALLTRKIPRITSPASCDKDWDGSEVTDHPFVEGWNICCRIFEIIRQCHAVPRDDKGYVRTSDINKMETFFSATKLEMSDRPNYSTMSRNLSDPWDDCDNTKDDNLPSLE